MTIHSIANHNIDNHATIKTIWSGTASAILNASDYAEYLEQIVRLCKGSAYAFSEQKTRDFLAQVLLRTTEPTVDCPTPGFCHGIYHGLITVEQEKIAIGALFAHVVFEVAEVEYLVVSREHQRSNHAKAMLSAFESSLAELNCTQILLEVGVQNIPAQNLYRRAGFSEIAIRKNYYNGTEDAIVMEKKLTICSPQEH